MYLKFIYSNNLKLVNFIRQISLLINFQCFELFLSEIYKLLLINNTNFEQLLNHNNLKDMKKVFSAFKYKTVISNIT